MKRKFKKSLRDRIRPVNTKKPVPKYLRSSMKKHYWCKDHFYRGKPSATLRMVKLNRKRARIRNKKSKRRKERLANKETKWNYRFKGKGKKRRIIRPIAFSVRKPYQSIARTQEEFMRRYG